MVMGGDGMGTDVTASAAAMIQVGADRRGVLLSSMIWGGTFIIEPEAAAALADQLSMRAIEARELLRSSS